MNITSALLTVDKTEGWTSHDVINVLRGKLDFKKIGHSGTLDPCATGLLLLLLGNATKKQPEFLHLPKVYRVALKLGTATTTWDKMGKVTDQKPYRMQTETELKNALQKLTGEVMQKIPFFSAKKVGGKPMYTHAREGANIEKETKTTVYKYENISMQDGLICFDVFCSSGTYARSLGVMLAEILETCGHLESLRRLSIGDYNLDGAITPEQIKTMPVEDILKCLKPL
ncbi:MAG: tRNA pseudouridine(55) synthase TruB [Elusimicrobiaceae bacterium]|nr:tRNA pseudouridine(55) synthase TruB [Elusimicrobiaceae bacterium]